MVQKFSEIMDNYNDMSVAELGTSLLTRKEEQVRRQEKKDKKREILNDRQETKGIWIFKFT